MKFKLKLVKQDQPKRNYKLSVGLYQKMQEGNKIGYSKNSFSINDMRAAINTVFAKDPTRQVKIVTNQAGYDLFNEAIKEQLKIKKHDRKRLSIKSKIFK